MFVNRQVLTPLEPSKTIFKKLAKFSKISRDCETSEKNIVKPQKLISYLREFRKRNTLNSAYNDCPGTGVFQSLYPDIVIGENRYTLASWPRP